MGKTFAGSHKTGISKHWNDRGLNSGDLGTSARGLNTKLKVQDERQNGTKYDPSSGNMDRNKDIRGRTAYKRDQNICRVIDNNSYDVWCICRLVKPCKRCGGKLTDRDKTPTPGDRIGGPVRDSDGSDTPKSTGDSGDELADAHVDIPNGDIKRTSNTNVCVIEEGTYSNNANIDVKFSKNNRALGKREIGEINETTGINLQELFSKLDELNDRDEASLYKHGLNIADTPPGSPNSSMDSASTCSFDHFDFDTSFCSLKSTG